jgi:transcriptional regulator with XRE-family HTH domain
MLDGLYPYGHNPFPYMKELTVREARQRKGLTQERLADLSGLDQATISDLETGRHTNPRLDTITRLAQALGVAPSRLRFTSGLTRR